MGIHSLDLSPFIRVRTVPEMIPHSGCKRKTALSREFSDHIEYSLLCQYTGKKGEQNNSEITTLISSRFRLKMFTADA